MVLNPKNGYSYDMQGIESFTIIASGLFRRWATLQLIEICHLGAI